MDISTHSLHGECDCSCGQLENACNVHLPLPDLSEGCAVCGANKGQYGRRLTLCSACGERIYCSKDCQRQDWPDHRLECGKTSRISLECFYPAIALLADVAHTAVLPKHWALHFQLMNDPDPSVGLTPLPNNIHAMLLEIDDTECINSGPVDWAPHAQSPATALKMFTRVMRDGRLLPILTAVCVALLAEMYTTTSAGGSASVRQRLQYSTSPIADFGIVLGKVTVPQCERLAYKRASNGVVVLGQDPEQHWWLYFTTIRGEDFFLDVGLFPFNFSMVVETAPYRPSGLKGSVFNSFPVYCVNRQIRKYLSSIHLEHKRVSALRDTRLHRAVSSMTHEGGTDYAPILEFMEDIAGSKMVENEREEVEQVLVGLRPTLKDILQREAWKDYPERPEVLAHIDPEEEEAYIRQGPNLDTRTVPLDSCWFSS